jgi:outer membrane lipoprotein carrier protein
MKPIILCFSLVFIIVLKVSAQNDKEAVQIMDRFSATATGAPSISMKFKLVTTDQAENKNDTIDGSVIISKNKYKLTLPDNIVWFNGETSSSYLPTEKEVTINRPDKKDNSFQNHPSSIFTMYKSGYKIRLIEEINDNYIIDLYPEDLKTDLIRVRLFIGKISLDLNRLEYKRKDGIVVTLSVSDYNLKVRPEADTFVFKPELYEGVEVIDMR